jgi:hypothetical protein
MYLHIPQMNVEAAILMIIYWPLFTGNLCENALGFLAVMFQPT